MTLLVDSHCHLTSSELAPQIEAVLDRARAAGVGSIVCIGVDLEDGAAVLRLADRFPQVVPVCGIHPHEAGQMTADWAGGLGVLLDDPRVAAMGEMGLDYHYDFAPRSRQREVFAAQCAMAVARGKPIVIHCREAHDDVMAVLAEFPSLPGVVFHCFGGSAAEARHIIDRGYWISLTGVVTFKKNEALRETVRRLPLDRIMVETDAPYLSPEPVRSVRPNEPAFAAHTAKRLAEVFGMAYDEFAVRTTENARRFFGRPAI